MENERAIQATRDKPALEDLGVASLSRNSDGKARTSSREPTVTLWRYEGRFIAAEVSFDGAPADRRFAKQLRKNLAERVLLTPQAESKTEAVYRACLGDK
jgi:hypothetical protein